MKVVVLHPPLYPVNHKFFNELGKKVNLVVYSFGNQPGLHSHWKVKNFVNTDNKYDLRVIEGNTNLNRLAVSYRTQLNPSFLRKVYQDKPDVVISVAFWFPSLYMAFLKRIFGCKLVVLTDAIAQTETNNSKLRNIIRNIIVKNTDAFIASSDLTESYLEEKFPKALIKKSVQTIDVKSWQKAIERLPEKEEIRNELGLPNDKKIMLSIGNFIALKNLGSLIKQTKEIENGLLVLIGEGELKNDFVNQIKKNHLQDKVKLIGRKEGDELKKYFKAADVFLFPTNRDTFGYVVVEALASGLPVICSKNAGASTLISDGINGYVVDPKGNFVEKTKRVIQEATSLTTLVTKSIAKYTLQHKAKEFSQILISLNK